MRPRPDAAENESYNRGYDVEKARFNEAAARCRGKLAAVFATTTGVTGLQ